MENPILRGARPIRIFLSLIAGEALPREQRDEATYKRDWRLRTLLETHLAPLERLGQITLWHPGQTTEGLNWQQEVGDHLLAADLIVLLLSAQFFTDEHCLAQMRQAQRRYEAGLVRVVPLSLRPVANLASHPIGQLTCLPKQRRAISQARDKEQAITETAEELYAIVGEIRSFLQTEQHKPPALFFNVLSSPSVLPPQTLLLPRQSQIQVSQRLLSHSENTALVLTGLGGIGKTVLASQICQQCSQQVFWCEIGSATTLADLVRSLCLAVRRSPPAFSHPSVLAQELFALSRDVDCLLVLDQFENWLDPASAQVHQRAPGVDEWLTLLHHSTQTCAGRVLLTSRWYPRGTLPASGRVCEFPLPGLENAESLQLLRASACASIEQATDEELYALIQRSQGHPLTLTWLRDLLKSDPALTPALLLKAQGASTSWISNGMFAMLNTLYNEHLTREQQKLLLAFAVYRQAVPFEAALAIVATESMSAGSTWTSALLLLLDLRLLQSSREDCYALHAAVRDFLLQHYLSSRQDASRPLHLAAAAWYQRFLPDLTLLSPSVQESIDLHAIVEAAWHLCKGQQFWQAYRLIQASNCFSTLHRHGYCALLLNLYTELRAREDWFPDLSISAAFSNELGEILTALGQKQQALEHYQKALALYRQAGEDRSIVEVLDSLGGLHRGLGKPPLALACYEEALTICASSPDSLVWRGRTLNNLGKLLYEEGETKQQHRRKKEARLAYRRSLEYYQEALSWNEKYHLLLDAAVTCNNLGDAYQALGNYGRARVYYWRALECFRAQNDRRHEAMTLNNLGLLYQSLAGRQANENLLEEARICCERAYMLFHEVGDRWQEQRVLRNLGRFYITFPGDEVQKRHEKSLACFIVARKISEALDSQQERSIPSWVEKTIRTDLGNAQYEHLLAYVTKYAERIVEHFRPPS